MENMIETIENYVKKQFNISNVTSKFNQNKILNRIRVQFETKNVDFKSKIKFKRVISLGKKRSVAYFSNKFCLEYFLTKYFVNNIKDLKDKGLANMKIPTQKILNYLDNISFFEEFTVIRFDFKNYYNNLSSLYVYEKFVKNYKLSTIERFFLEQYVKQIPYCFAGLATSNYFAEIMDSYIEQQLETEFNKIGDAVCFHYGDDFNIFINKKLNKDFSLNIIQSKIFEIFHDDTISSNILNKEKIHTEGTKFTLMTNEDLPITFNFLGYEYLIYNENNKIDYTYGVVDYTINKYKQNLKDVLCKYKNNIEAQRIIVVMQTHKISYPNPSIFNNGKNISPRFNEQTKCLKFKPNKLNKKTKDFLQNVIYDCYKELDYKLPYFLADLSPNSKYNLFSNLIKGKFLFFDNKKGIEKNVLIKMAKPFDKNKNFDTLTYNQLALYLAEKTKINY